MSDQEHRKEDEFVPLAQAGIPHPDIERQLEKICHSEALENRHAKKKLLRHLVRESLAGNVQGLRVAPLTESLYGPYYSGDSRARVDTNKLREHLDEYYASPESEPGELRFTIPAGQYVVYTSRASGKKEAARAPRAPKPSVAGILEPVGNAEVHQRVPVRGRIDALDLNLRPWLVVRTPVGDHYPQCRVRRDSRPEWEEEVRIGLLQWGADEGAVYEILLVAADADGDAAFYQYLKSGRDGFGPMLPTDCTVLDAKRVTRRDIRA